MKRVMHRLFWAWDFDREEDWLNAWAARGLALVDVCGIRYVFEEGISEADIVLERREPWNRSR